MVQLQKMKEMLPSLPPEMQEIIMQTLNQRNNVDDSWEYHKEIQKYQQEEFLEDPLNGARRFTTTASPMDQSFWNQYDSNIIESNFPEDNYKNFDINDYID